MNQTVMYHRFRVGERAHLAMEDEDVVIKGIAFSLDHTGKPDEVTYYCKGDSGMGYVAKQRHLDTPKSLTKKR